jgi:hypothetical protein
MAEDKKPTEENTETTGPSTGNDSLEKEIEHELESWSPMRWRRMGLLALGVLILILLVAQFLGGYGSQ